MFARFSVPLVLSVLSSASAMATPNCLRDNQPYKLAGDTMGWSMTIAPGADCIQGLRWSTMQIYSVSVSEKPRNGELVLVGPGFRYFAKPDFQGTDHFALVVVGKNRRDQGTSTLQITVSPGVSLTASARTPRQAANPEGTRATLVTSGAAAGSGT